MQAQSGGSGATQCIVRTAPRSRRGRAALTAHGHGHGCVYVVCVRVTHCVCVCVYVCDTVSGLCIGGEDGGEGGKRGPGAKATLHCIALHCHLASRQLVLL